MITIKPLKQTVDGYVYGTEGETGCIHIPFSKIEWFLNQLLGIKGRAEAAHQALCSFNFDFPGGSDQFYADNYPPENEWDHKEQRNRRSRRIIQNYQQRLNRAKETS